MPPSGLSWSNPLQISSISPTFFSTWKHWDRCYYWPHPLSLRRLLHWRFLAANVNFHISLLAISARIPFSGQKYSCTCWFVHLPEKRKHNIFCCHIVSYFCLCLFCLKGSDAPQLVTKRHMCAEVIGLWQRCHHQHPSLWPFNVKWATRYRAEAFLCSSAG